VDRLGYQELQPSALRRYVIVVSAAGVALACALALFVGHLSDNQVRIAAVLTILAMIGERYPLQLTHKTTINVSSAAYFAMVLTLPAALPGVLALLAISVGQELRRRTNPTITLPEMFFNIGQGALYTAIGALVYVGAVDQPFGPHIGELGSLGPMVVAAMAMHLVNTGAVAGAAGLQLGISPVRVWTRNLAMDIAPQGTLAIIGTLAASVALHAWYLVPFLALPGVLVQRAVRETVRLRAETYEALAALVEVVELRDPYTAGHSRRVAATARMIASQLRLTAEEADLIESAGQVHDIGKVAIDPQILLKTSKLSDDEFGQMQLHPVYGANVVDRFAAYRECAKFVRHHHERWDGAGYPDRIAGEEIPLGARILAVADSFDAMTSDRPYREGMAVERAISILREGAGTQWDPAVVDAFVALMVNRPGDVPVYRRSDATVPAKPGPASDQNEASSTEAA
jgi:HD-GYP domain-containing protein (c-di-GMP phosphodiesterase class II)